MKSASNKKKIETLTVCMAIGVVAGGVLGAAAQGRQDRGADRPVMEQRLRQTPVERTGANMDERQPGTTPDAPHSQAGRMVRASILLDMDVHGRDGRKLGSVDEIVLSQDRRGVEHIKVSLDDGDSVNLAMHEVSVKYDDDDVLLVQASKQELQQRQMKDRHRDRAQVGLEQNERESRRVGKLIGMEVRGTDNKDVGSINDLIVDIKNGQITAAAIQTGGMLGLRIRLASVEWQQMNFAADDDTASVNMTKETLSARELKQAAFWKRHAPEAGKAQSERDPHQLGRSTPGAGLRIEDHRTDEATKADNTGRNVRDRNDATLTPFDQGNSKADTETTAQIRRLINATENMSLSGKNVKIITRDGRVTLRGPVETADEKRLIGEIANRIARPANVDNQLEVKAANGN